MRHQPEKPTQPEPISTHAPLARCDPGNRLDYAVQVISTHAPLARCDRVCDLYPAANPISTHAPLARCDRQPGSRNSRITNFNSRTSCEVRHHRRPIHSRPDISTHAPLARCDNAGRCPNRRHSFQLTHLLRGATRWVAARSLRRRYFNSRTSCEVRPDHRRPIHSRPDISTHAPLARCDERRQQLVRRLSNFNSRTSCEVRPQTARLGLLQPNFNSRTSCEVRP